MYSNNNHVNLYRKIRVPVEPKSVSYSTPSIVEHKYPQFKEISPEANYAICSYGQAMINMNLPKQIIK